MAKTGIGRHCRYLSSIIPIRCFHEKTANSRWNRVEENIEEKGERERERMIDPRKSISFFVSTVFREV